jgi:hypothetical protein
MKCKYESGVASTITKVKSVRSVRKRKGSDLGIAQSDLEGTRNRL